MSIINTQPLIGASGQGGGYNLTKSLRFRSSASAYLSRTPASAGNRSTWTFSAWVKKANLTAQQVIFSGGTDVNCIYIEGGDGTIGIDGIYNGTRHLRYTTAVFRDPAAWYHIVAVLDTTQATDTNRLKMFVNGVQVALPTAAVGSYPAQNSTGNINTALTHSIGRRQHIPDNYYDGYVTEVNFIDGQALTPSSFGETDTITGVWKPKAYTGTYGTNGFYLPFTDVATTSGSNAGLGKDFSGNGNYWTTNNISVTSGATYDSMTDVPTLTSATTANYAVINPLGNNIGTTSTLSNGNLTATSGGNSWWNSSIEIPSTGKWYAEFNPASTSNTPWIAVFTSTSTNAQYVSNGEIRVNNSTVTTVASYTSSDTIGIAYDTDGTITFYKNNTSVYSGSLTYAAPMFFAGFVSTGNTINMNFGQRPFAYTPPTGYKALNTYNLPDSTIVAGNTVMDATLYTGNSSTNNVVNTAGFKPDLVWVKSRNVGGNNHNLWDSVRGAGKALISNLTDSEYTATGMTGFASNGFTFSGTAMDSNTTGNNLVAWQWQAGQGTTSSNTAGSITSTVSVNASAGFSIVTYTGSGAASATIGHGLGVAPSLIFLKKRNAVSPWYTYHSAVGASSILYLNTTDAAGASSAWNSTAPTSTVFSVASSLNDANTFVAYCWSEIAGFSKFGSYTGNGSTDGTFCYTGFRPKFVMFKRTDAAASWLMLDSSRNTYNVMTGQLYANSSVDEQTGATADFLSNGIKIRETGGGTNASGSPYIYACFAENPLKHSLAR